MKSRLLPLLFLLAFASCANQRYAAGPLSQDIEALPGYRGYIKAISYKSSERDLQERRMTVYLPENYYDDTARRFPVMYLFHGARGNEVTWIERGDCLITLDSLRARGAASDFILVLTNENNYYGDKDYKNGHAVDAVRAFWTVDGVTESFFMKDVVATVDSLFRTVPKKKGRAIAGMSTGALQAMHISANNPDSFEYVGLFSAYAYDVAAGLRNPPFYFGLWPKLEKQFETPPSYYGLYIGNTDIFYPHMVMFHNALTRKGYEHGFTVTPGGHEWYNWRKFFILFSEKAFKNQ